MCIENSIKLEEENQEKLFTISEIGKMLGKTRSMIVGLVDELNLVNKSNNNTQLYNYNDLQKIIKLNEYKTYFYSLYSQHDLCKICDLYENTIKRIIKELNIIGETYKKYTRYSKEELQQIQKFIEEHDNLKLYFYEQTCMEKYGVKNTYQIKEINEKAIKNSHTLECIEKQNKNRDEHYKDVGGYSNYMSNLNKERWESYTKEEKESRMMDLQNKMIEKYGVDNCSKLDWVKEKKKKSTLKSIGFDNPLKDKERMEQGMLTKYGVKHNWESKELLERRGQTFHENYEEYKKNKTEDSELRYVDKSVDTSRKNYEEYKKNKSENLELKYYDKAKQTCIERYGENYKEIFTEKAMETNKRNHDGLHNSQTKECQDKMKQTYFEKTGYYHPSQNPKTRRNHRTCYYYDNEEFDSSWELAYYIYLKDHDIQFEYHTISVPYEWNGEIHYYKIDFKVGDEYVEVKGDHLLKKNVYTEDGRCEAKYEYMKEHNITVLSLEEIKPYLKYIKDIYGKDYLKSFRKKNEDEK